MSTVSKTKKGATREIGRASGGRVTEPLHLFNHSTGSTTERERERVLLYIIVDGDEVQHGYLIKVDVDRIRGRRGLENREI